MLKKFADYIQKIRSLRIYLTTAGIVAADSKNSIYQCYFFHKGARRKKMNFDKIINIRIFKPRTYLPYPKSELDVCRYSREVEERITPGSRVELTGREGTMMDITTLL